MHSGLLKMDYIFLMLSAMWGKVFEVLDLRIWGKKNEYSSCKCVCVCVYARIYVCTHVCVCVRVCATVSVCIVRGAQAEPESQDCLLAD